jgi:hypothetical protein
MKLHGGNSSVWQRALWPRARRVAGCNGSSLPWPTSADCRRSIRQWRHRHHRTVDRAMALGSA